MSYIVVPDILVTQATLRPYAPFITDGASTTAYDAFHALLQKLTAFLIKEAHLEKSDRVLLLLPNSLEFYIAFFATISAGCIAVPLSSKIPMNRLQRIIGDCRPKGIITSRCPGEILRENTQPFFNFFVYVGNLPAETAALTGSLDNEQQGMPIQTLEEILRSTQGEAVPPSLIDLDPAMIIYTSGSTGVPKGIVCSHLNVISASRSIVQYLAMSDSEVILNVLPPFFDYGLYQAILSAYVGAQMVIAREATFMDEIIRLMNEYGVTGFPLVPSLAVSFLKYVRSNIDQALKEETRNKVNFVSSTGATFHPRYIDGLRKVFPFARIYSMYGLTECKRVSYLDPQLIDQKQYSVGKPMPNVEAWIVNEADEKVPIGKVGTLMVRGSNVAIGYWNDEELTSKIFKIGNFGERILYTNDLFKQDEDGFLYFVGRKDDIIKSGGLRISLVEIANIMLEIEGLSEVAVLSEPHHELGEVMKAFVVLDTDAHLTPQVIKSKMRYLVESNLMMPIRVEIVDELPKTMTGKIAKAALHSN